MVYCSQHCAETVHDSALSNNGGLCCGSDCLWQDLSLSFQRGCDVLGVSISRGPEYRPQDNNNHGLQKRVSRFPKAKP